MEKQKIIRTSLLDDFIGIFSPAEKTRRFQHKVYLDMMSHRLASRKYEGASRGRRTEGWVTAGTSANVEIKASIKILRERSRDLVRNNPYATRAIEVLASNVVGSGIMTQVKSTSKGNLSRVTDLWGMWTEDGLCDADGVHDFMGLQRLVIRTIAESGGALVRRIRTNNLLVPFKVQVLEPDFLDSRLSVDSSTKNPIIMGIEFDKDTGVKVAYHIFEQHPGGTGGGIFTTGSFRSNRIPAEDILHIYRMDRPSQVMGVPWLAPAIIRLRDFDEYEDAQLVRQKIAACYSVFIRDMELNDLSTETKKIEMGEKVEPGMIEFLPPGKSVEFGKPPEVEGYAEYTTKLLQGISIGVGVPYSSMTGDYSQVNFSSGRMSHIEFGKSIVQWQWMMMIPSFIKPVFNWFLEGIELAGANVRGVSSVHTTPRREMVDPTKEIPAIMKAIRSGLISLPEAVRSFGFDFTHQLKEIADSNAELDKLGIILDIDPRKVSQVGLFQSEPEKSEESENDA